MKEVLRIYIFLLIILCFLFSCSSTKYVPDGQYLLDKVEIKSDNKNFKSTDLKDYLRQQPNFKMFGLIKTQLYLYDWSGRDSTKWLSRQLRRMGEAPVIMDTALIRQSEEELERFFINKGYMNAEVESAIDTAKYKKAKVTYQIVANEPYKIQNYTMEITDAKIDSIARLKAPKRHRFSSMFSETQNVYTPLIKEGSLFDRDVLDQERQRLTTLLRRRGYYAFNKDYIAYLADSTLNKNIVDLNLYVKPFLAALPNGETEKQPHRPYYINNVSVVTDYDPVKMGEEGSMYRVTDTLKTDKFSIYYGENGRSIRPTVLSRSCYLIPGELYNERKVEQTYSAFSTLNALRNVNIRFNEVMENDTMKLNCTILTSPAKPQSFGVDLEGTNTAGDFGFATGLSYQHRNIFQGSEVFGIKLRGAYEALSNSFSKNMLEFGVETSLTFPQFLFPFLNSNFKRRLRASTEIRFSYNMQKRPEYDRKIVSGSWGYSWQSRTNRSVRHTFKLLNIDYMYLPYKDSSFMANIPDYVAKYNYSNQFTVGSSYTYSFSNYDPQNRHRDTRSLRIAVESAGNFLYAMSKILGKQQDSERKYTLFGIKYSQYIKGDIDFSKTFALDNRNTLAFHVGGGVGYPYGNAIMPWEKMYFSGGANSVRGWSVRSLGPGSLSKDSVKTFVDQSGEMRLDMNVEYRTKLFWKFEMAAYIDAGNIWNVKKRSDMPDANFDFGRFYREIAVSYGLGLRLDFDFFLVRFDTGFKAYDPQERGGRRWAIKNPNFKNNFAWHFAVGYPF
ncbi:translocation and assembly module lipoprotein TamL [Parabacteroides pacaensis]|uniref:translocation and assembly module lipoprotein TamL n=1 Tax=Parabacteroides pacaensis TaxID=2086575 RepID=UPI000D1076F4|nr:BamA/TamA family outer membrane protein [Parabacteroides pacaensis]